MRRLTSALALVGSLVAVAPAAATTFCVPSFHAACPDNGTNVAKADLEDAMGTSGSDGNADSVIVAPGTYSDDDSFAPGGIDPLEVTGAGRTATRLTTSSNGNIFVVNLGGRQTVLRDVTVIVPAGLPDGLGGGVQLSRGDLERVDIEIRNPGSGAIPSLTGGNSYVDGTIYSTGAGTVPYGIQTNPANGGEVTLERLTIRAANGVYHAADSIDVHIDRSRLIVSNGGVDVAGGGSALVDNTVIETSGGIPLQSRSTNSSLTELVARNVTLVRKAGDPVAVSVEGGSNGSAALTVRNSILHGFTQSWSRTSPAGPGTGQGDLIISHSNLPPVGTDNGAGIYQVTTGNIFADPQFAGVADYHLTAGSPSIDAGGAAAPLVGDDFDGVARPVDGNGDGTAVHDQGAFEYVPPPADPGGGGGDPPPPGGGDPPLPDTTAPLLTQVRFSKRVSRRRGGALRLTLSEPARVVAAFKRGKRVRRLRMDGAAGANRLRIARRKLAARRYRVTVIATDAAGNRSKMVRRKLRVRRR